MSVKPDRLHLFPPFGVACQDVFLTRRMVWAGTELDSVEPEIVCNVQQELWLWPEVGYGWGQQRREGVTLALNILDRLIPAADGQVCDEWHQALACSDEAFGFAFHFWQAFLVSVPFWGGRLDGSAIRDWLPLERQRWELNPEASTRRTPMDEWPVG